MSKKNSTRTFRYKASPSVILLFVEILIAVIIIFVLMTIEMNDSSIIHFSIAAILYLSCHLLSICMKSSSKRMVIGRDQIVFEIGLCRGFS